MTTEIERMQRAHIEHIMHIENIWRERMRVVVAIAVVAAVLCFAGGVVLGISLWSMT